MDMEEFIKDLASYAKSVGLKPGTIIQNAGYRNGSVWEKWVSRDSVPTHSTTDKVRKYMTDNPPKLKEVG